MPINFPDNPTDNQEFNGYIYDATRGVWDVKLASDPLGSISLTTPAQGEVLSFDGTNWANQELQITSTIQDLTDTTVTSPSEGDVMVYDGSSWINTPATSGNAIINGDFGIWQRGTSFNGHGIFGPDRWQLFEGVPGDTDWTRESFTPSDIEAIGYGDAQYFLRATINTAGDLRFLQPVEDVRTLAGQQVTLSFWARSADGLDVENIFLIQKFGSGGSADVVNNLGSFSITPSWSRYSVTSTLPSMLGKTIGPDSHIEVRLDPPGSSTGTIDFWGVQLEAGSVATPFRLAGGGSKGAELALCQRYYASASGLMSRFYNYSSGTANVTLPSLLPTTMRATPTITAVIDVNDGTSTSPTVVYAFNTSHFFIQQNGVPSGQFVDLNFFEADAEL